MEKAKMQTKTERFDELIQKFSTETDLETTVTNLELRCKIGLKKLGIMREFTEIDSEILDLSINNESGCSVDFLSSLLALETKRLKFKEEVAKCLENKTKIS